jgi:hypothetical protein
MKDPDNGYDYSFTLIKQGHETVCKNPGIGYTQPGPGSDTLPPDAQEILRTAVLQSEIQLGPLKKVPATKRALPTGTTTTTSSPTSTVTDAALPQEDLTTGTLLSRRVENHLQEPAKWCQERRLVISEYDFHSAKDVCEVGEGGGEDEGV